MATRTLICLALVLALVALAKTQDGYHHGPWVWNCEADTDQERCVKYLAIDSPSGESFHKCRITCGPHGALWPKPTVAALGKDVVSFSVSSIQHSLTCEGQVCDLLGEAVEIFKDNLQMYHPMYDHTTKTAPWGESSNVKQPIIEIVINVAAADTHLTLNVDESYSLIVSDLGDEVQVQISATTFFGARHGLETLSQLIDYDEGNSALILVNSASVTDAPTFTYRGILLDTSRNYLTIGDLQRTIDGMAMNKLNTFHWHITDSHSFPFVMPSLPNMTYYGAYSEEKIYHPQQIKDIVHYGVVRGVRVLPEFDAPAHVGNGFQWGELEGLGKLTVCTNKEPWMLYCVEPPCGQMNLANPEMYNVLSKIYDEFVDAFSPIDIFHYGGDEVNLNCWNTTDEIVDWMTENGYGLSDDSYYQQWSVFQEEALKRFTAANGEKVPGILWTSHLTEAGRAGQYLNPDDYIIQIWTTGSDPVIRELLELGFDLIFSNYDDLYLDCGVGAWIGEGVNWCSPYKGWQKIYQNDPLAMAGDAYHSQVMGGEAALWTEQVDSTSVDSRLWPRGAALGERLWSNPSEGWRLAEIRMINQRQRMVQRGVGADRLQPQWCHQNDNQCHV